MGHMYRCTVRVQNAHDMFYSIGHKIANPDQRLCVATCSVISVQICGGVLAQAIQGTAKHCVYESARLRVQVAPSMCHQAAYGVVVSAPCGHAIVSPLCIISLQPWGARVQWYTMGRSPNAHALLPSRLRFVPRPQVQALRRLQARAMPPPGRARPHICSNVVLYSRRRCAWHEVTWPQ